MVQEIGARPYLKTRPNRFEFVFTPKHGSWLNLVEVFFAKMTKTILRGIRVASKAELKARIRHYLQDLNAARSYSGGATRLKKSPFHKAVFSFILFYPNTVRFRVSAF